MSSSKGGGQCGERRTSECPASGVMGIRVLELGKRVRWTSGVHAPAACMVSESVVNIGGQKTCLRRREQASGPGIMMERGLIAEKE